MSIPEPLTDDEISERLAALPGWERDGDAVAAAHGADPV